jgi:hypothetical protein
MASPEAWNRTLVTATGQVFGQGVEFGGVHLSVAGTSTTVTVYDNTSAAGDPIIPTTAALTVGQYVPPTGLALNTTLPTNGIRITTGLYVTVGGTGSPKIYILWR